MNYIVRPLCVVVLAAIFIGVFAVSAARSQAENGSIPPTPVPLPQHFSTVENNSELKARAHKLADAVATRYTDMRSLQFVAHINHEDSSMTVQCFMEPARLRSEVFTSTGETYTLFLLNNNTMTEYGDKLYVKDGPDHTIPKWGIESYTPPLPGGTDNPRFNMPDMCFYGRYTETWVGPHSTFTLDKNVEQGTGSFVTKRIRHADAIATQELNGMKYTVVRTLTGNFRTDTCWIDSDNMLRQWTTEEKSELTVTKRSRVYTNIVVNGAIAPETWTVGPRK